MEVQDNLKKIANYLISEFEIFKIRRGHIYLPSGTKQKYDTFIKNLKVDHFLNPVFSPYKSQNEIFKAIREALEVAASILRDKNGENTDDENLVGDKVEYANLVPLIDILNGDNYILWSKESNQISEISFQSFYKTLHPDDQERVRMMTKMASFQYDPYDITPMRLIDFEEHKVWRVNLYVPPAWRKADLEEVEAPPRLFWKLIVHLFPDKDVREFVLQWSYNMLMRRCETYLVLNGKKGLGKGLFCQLLRALVGDRHYLDAPESLLSTSSHFNSALDRKRFILFDEFKVDKGRHTLLKRYANEWVNIEKKGYDADKSIRIFNSYAISNNDETDMYLESDDRRFSVPDMFDKRLEDVFSIEERHKLIEDLKDETQIAQFGNWLMGLYEDRSLDPFATYKGKKFFRLVYNSLTEWQRLIVDKVTQAEEGFYSLRTLGRELSRDNPAKTVNFPRNRQKVEDFLNNYLHEGDAPLGVLVFQDEEWGIKVDDCWKKEVEEDDL